MRHAIATVALVGLELLVAACIGSSVQPSAVPPPPSAVTSPAPTATSPYERDSILQKTVIDYYTVGQGQRYYDENIRDDVLGTRFYIYEPKTGKMGVVVRVEGTINSLVKDNAGLLYFDINRIQNADDAKIYERFVLKVLPTPNINYHQTSKGQGIYTSNDPPVPVPVGIVGKLPSKLPVTPKDPFEILMSLPPEIRERQEIVKRTSPTTDDEIYVQPVARLIQDSNVFTFLDLNGQQFQVPAQGSILLEIVVLDTQHPANAALLTGLTPVAKPGVPKYKAD